MLRVIVQVQSNQSIHSEDLEVPAEVPAEELGRLIALAMEWSQDPNGRELQHSIFADPPGRVLNVQETLADVEAWDGSSLTLRAILAAYFESSSGKQYSLYRDRVRIGRAGRNKSGKPDDGLIDLSQEERGPTVSRDHARVFYTKGQWQVVHYSQTNETALNGQVLSFDDRMALRDGDVLEVGGVKLTFHLGMPTEPHQDTTGKEES
jgi:hypothetical protein